jgi:hypothetical protein
MSIYQDYSGVYGELTDAEKEDLGKFGADLISAKITLDAGKIAELIKEAANDIDNEDDLEAFLGLASWLEKEAWSDSTTNTLRNVVLPIAGVAFAATPLIVHGTRAAMRAQKHGQSLKTILSEHPALREDPNTSRYFHMIKSFAPDVAANSLIAGNVMEELRKLGPAAVTPARISELLQLQGRISDDRSRVPELVASSGKDAVKAFMPEKVESEEDSELAKAEKKLLAHKALQAKYPNDNLGRRH